MNWQTVLDNLRKWRKEDDTWQKAMDDFCTVLAPNSYAPILEAKYITAYLDGLCRGDAELKDILEYWIYEVPSMKEATVSQKDKKWDFKKDEGVIDYLTKNHGKEIK